MHIADKSEAPAALEHLDQGEPPSTEKLLALLYSELHHMAERFMRGQPEGHTLQATALLNEAFLRLSGKQERTWTNRKHFMSMAASAMRCVLIDHARTKLRRAASFEEPTALDRVMVTYQEKAMDLLALDEALQKLAGFDRSMALAVELRFFAGLTMNEVAEVLDIPKRTLEREWEATRVWLFEEMS